jgi:hypothetical protein
MFDEPDTKFSAWFPIGVTVAALMMVVLIVWWCLAPFRADEATCAAIKCPNGDIAVPQYTPSDALRCVCYADPPGTVGP